MATKRSGFWGKLFLGMFLAFLAWLAWSLWQAWHRKAYKSDAGLKPAPIGATDLDVEVAKDLNFAIDPALDKDRPSTHFSWSELEAPGPLSPADEPEWSMYRRLAQRLEFVRGALNNQRPVKVLDVKRVGSDESAFSALVQVVPDNSRGGPGVIGTYDYLRQQALNQGKRPLTDGLSVQATAVPDQYIVGPPWLT